MPRSTYKVSLTDVLGDPDFHQLPPGEKVKVLAAISGPGNVPQPNMNDIGLNLPGNTDQQNTLGVLRSMFPSIRTEQNPSSNPVMSGNPNVEGSKVANAENSTNMLSPAILAGGTIAATAPYTLPVLGATARLAAPYVAKALGAGGGWELYKYLRDYFGGNSNK